MCIKEKVKEAKHSEDRIVNGAFMPEWRRRIGEDRNVRYITSLSQIPQLPPEERERLQKVADTFGFRTNSYYLSLVNWDDPKDPIRRLIIPDPEELEDVTTLLDASHEAAITVAPGCEHKYSNTALILLSKVCGAVCRFCFRKRIFMPDNTEVSPNLEPAYEYIRNHPEIDNVLLTGGDPLMLSTRKIASVLHNLRAIPHVKIIRFGSKLPAFNPFRFIDDDELLDLFEMHSHPDKRIYVVSHFNHPREISEVAIQAIELLLKRGIIIINQTPLLIGINDDADTLGELCTKLAQVGVAPYYVFQCRPTRGNAHFKTSMVRGVDLTEAAKRLGSGLAKRFRYAGSHASGKIEIIGYDDKYQYFRYHQSKDPRHYGRFFRLPRKDEATWWDDWMPNGESFTIEDCPDVELGSGSP